MSIKTPVCLICQTLNLSRSAYYYRKKHPVTAREAAYGQLKAKAQALFLENNSEYGRIRLHKALKEAGEKVSLGKTARLMRDAGLVPRAQRVYKATTNSQHHDPVAENRLNQDFEAQAPNQKWCGDSTYIPTDEGWLYVAGILDLCDRTCVGLDFSPCHTKELMLKTLDHAKQRYRPNAGLIFHSDRGVQYASNAYRERLESYGMIQSMSRSGNPYDNAVMESFWATVKKGCVFGEHFKTRKAAEQAIFQYVFGFYNTRRYHTSLGLKTPLEYRQQFFELA